jgi:hypothetical protein
LILNIGGLIKPITKLIEVFASGAGVVYEPFGIVRKAKAHATAELIYDDADQGLARRTMARIGHTEMRRQKNIESVFNLAKAELPPTVDPAPVDPNWLNHFFSTVQDISSEDMQRIWARILVGQISKPGSFDRRVVEFLKTFNIEEAKMLTSLLSVTFTTTDGWNFYFVAPVTYDEMGAQVGSKLEWQGHMIAIGLLDAEAHPLNASIAKDFEFLFGDRPLKFEISPPSATKNLGIPLIEPRIEIRSLTSIGQQLSRVASTPKRDGIVDKLNANVAERMRWAVKDRR